MAGADDIAQVAELLERLLVDSELRARFRTDPAAVCRATGLTALADELGGPAKALYTLELRESRSSLAGVLMAAAIEGIAGVEVLRRIETAEQIPPAQARELVRALTGSLAAVPAPREPAVDVADAPAAPREARGTSGTPHEVPEIRRRLLAEDAPAEPRENREAGQRAAGARAGDDPAVARAATGVQKTAAPAPEPERARPAAAPAEPRVPFRDREAGVQASAAARVAATGSFAAASGAAGGTLGLQVPVAAAPDPNALAPIVAPGALGESVLDGNLSRSEFALQDAEGAPDVNGVSWHAGKDFFAEPGTPIGSPVAGEIVEVRPSEGTSGQVFGGVVKVRATDGMVWVFRHVDPGPLTEGQQVAAGTPIATVSAWDGGAEHTHIELWKTLEGGYNYENMEDPLPYLQRAYAEAPAGTVPAPIDLGAVTEPEGADRELAVALAAPAGHPTAPADDLLSNPRLVLDDAARQALASGGADARVVSVLRDLAEDHTLEVAGVGDGRGITLVAVDGAPVSPSNVAARDVAERIASVASSLRVEQVATPWPIDGSGFVSGPEDRIEIVFAPVPGIGAVGADAAAQRAAAAVMYAERFLGTEYVWGGESLAESGVDCSGLMQNAYAEAGVDLPRVAQDQFGVGEPVGREQLQPGDLVFFGSPGNIHHVGMYLGDGNFLHAPHTGDVVKISNLESDGYMDEFAGGRRVAGLAAPDAPVPEIAAAGSPSPASVPGSVAAAAAGARPVTAGFAAVGAPRAAARVDTIGLARVLPAVQPAGDPAVPSPDPAAPAVPAAAETPAPAAGEPVPAAVGAPAELPPAAELVTQLDQWFAASAPDSPLIGQSQFFVDSGLRHGVDPRLLAAIAAHESSFGRSQFDENNVFGWFSGEHYASIAENVEAVATGLRANYLDQGLHSVATIGARYAPVGASNDPTNLNSNWVVGVSRFYGELGGNPEQVP